MTKCTGHEDEVDPSGSAEDVAAGGKLDYLPFINREFTIIGYAATKESIALANLLPSECAPTIQG